ncbi:flagellar hook-length control protein FliK [Variovorax paradoxus]|nr:flagellar hook-length control protein FliK [Variovorax paradoxus]
MSTFIAPSAGPNAPGQPLSASGPRGRMADEPQGGRFGDALERSRAAGARKSEAASDAPSAEAAAQQKPERAADKKEDRVSDLLAFALFAPAPVPVQATGVAAPATGAPSEGTAELALATDVAQDPLLAQTPAKALLPEAGSEATATPAAVAADTDAQAKTLPASARAAQADTAAKAAPLAAVSGAAEAAAPAAVAALPLPPAASALPSAKALASAAAAPVSAMEAAQAQASAAVPAAEEAKAAPIVAATGRDRPDPAAAADTVTPPLAVASTSFAPQAVERPGAAATPTPLLTVAPPVGSDEWGPAIGQQMLRMSAGSHQVAELNLNPAGLGPLKVTLALGDNQAQAMFVSAHESVRKAVEAALPQLRSTLAEQGISLGQTSVGAESRPWAGQGGGFGQQQQQQPGASRQADYPGASRADTSAGAAPRGLPATARHTGNGVDTFA